MATKKKSNRESSAISATEETPMPETPQSWWPEEFAAPRTAALAGAFVFVWSVLLFSAGAFNSLLWLKRLQLVILGVYQPTVLAAETGSWDAASVLWAFGVFFAAMVVHPGLALAFLMLLRPWLDAYTYPTDNMYFTWAALFLMLMCVRSTRHKIPVLLFLGFFVFILLSTYTSIHYNKSFRIAVFWAGDLALFISVLNLAQNRRIFNLLLCAFMVTLATEVLYAIPHYKLLLPYIRKSLIEDPNMRMQYYGTTEMSPELARRFNINRAFGNMLFPNALAGYYVLCLPPLLSLLWIGCAKFKALYTQTTGIKSQAGQGMAALLFAGVAFLITSVTVFVEGSFASALGDPKDINWYEGTTFIAIYSVILGLAIALALYGLARRGGLSLSMYGAWALGTLLLTPALIYSLVTTYSRGAFLALFVALVLGAILLFWPAVQLPKKLRKVFVALFLCAAMAASTLAYAQALAPNSGAPNTAAKMTTPPPSIAAPKSIAALQSAAAPTNQGEVLESGLDLSMEDLSDTSTFKLRVSYWRVGMRMLSDFWLPGIGLGAFEMAYPKYQRIGDGEVREAHNSVLQMFIETGVLGGVFFVLFWGYILIWGMRRILLTHNKTKRILLCGIYTGLLAFLGHSLMDIHFSHQGMIFFLLIITALFIARAAPEANNSPVIAPRWASILVLGFCVVASGLGLQFYLRDFALNRGSMIDVANTDDIDFRKQVATYFFTKGREYVANPASPPPQLSYAAAQMLFPDRETIETFAELYAPVDGGKGLRKLGSEESIPFNAVVRVLKRHRASRLSIDYTLEWLENWERIDSAFPYDPKLAMWIAKMYQKINYLCYMPLNQGRRLEMVEKAKFWFECSRDRNPMNTESHANYAGILHLESTFYTGEKRVALLEQALAEARVVIDLSPVSSEAAYGLAWHLESLASHMDEQEATKARAAELKTEAKKIREATALLIDKLVDVKRPIGQKKYSTVN